MGIRQAINEKPAISAGVTLVVIALAVGFILWQSFGHHSRDAALLGRAFYSDDDGKTWFEDEANKLTPFTDSNGKPAVQAFVFKCGGGQPFVGYLMETTEEARQRLSADQPHAAAAAALMHSEVKKPGAKTWVKFDPKNTAPFISITHFSCPDGGKPVPVLPGT